MKQILELSHIAELESLADNIVKITFDKGTMFKHSITNKFYKLNPAVMVVVDDSPKSPYSTYTTYYHTTYYLDGYQQKGEYRDVRNRFCELVENILEMSIEDFTEGKFSFLTDEENAKLPDLWLPPIAVGPININIASFNITS